MRDGGRGFAVLWAGVRSAARDSCPVNGRGGVSNNRRQCGQRREPLFFTKLLDALGTDADSGLMKIDSGLRHALTVGRPISERPTESLSDMDIEDWRRRG